MKFLPLASLTLTAPLLLTGCASSPSLENQTKLIEYEKCLEWEIKRIEIFLNSEMYGGENYPSAKILLADRIEKSLKETDFEGLTPDCEKYRP